MHRPHICVCCLVARLRPTLLQLRDCSLPGCSVQGTSQARILEWVAIVFSRRSSQPRDGTRISYIGRWMLCHWATRETLPPVCLNSLFIHLLVIKMRLLWTSMYKFLHGNRCSFLLSVCLGVELLVYMVSLYVSLFEDCLTVFQSDCTILRSHQECMKFQLVHVYREILREDLNKCIQRELKNVTSFWWLPESHFAIYFGK